MNIQPRFYFEAFNSQENANQELSLFENLPSEITAIVASYLTLADQAKVAVTSRHNLHEWHAILSHTLKGTHTKEMQVAFDSFSAITNLYQDIRSSTPVLSPESIKVFKAIEKFLQESDFVFVGTTNYQQWQTQWPLKAMTLCDKALSSLKEMKVTTERAHYPALFEFLKSDCHKKLYGLFNARTPFISYHLETGERFISINPFLEDESKDRYSDLRLHEFLEILHNQKEIPLRILNDCTKSALNAALANNDIPRVTLIVKIFKNHNPQGTLEVSSQQLCQIIGYGIKEALNGSIDFALEICLDLIPALRTKKLPKRDMVVFLGTLFFACCKGNRMGELTSIMNIRNFYILTTAPDVFFTMISSQSPIVLTKALIYYFQEAFKSPLISEKFLNQCISQILENLMTMGWSKVAFSSILILLQDLCRHKRIETIFLEKTFLTLLTDFHKPDIFNRSPLQDLYWSCLNLDAHFPNDQSTLDSPMHVIRQLQNSELPPKNALIVALNRACVHLDSSVVRPGIWGTAFSQLHREVGEIPLLHPLIIRATAQACLKNWKNAIILVQFIDDGSKDRGLWEVAQYCQDEKARLTMIQDSMSPLSPYKDKMKKLIQNAPSLNLVPEKRPKKRARV